ncbi:arginase family protein [Microbacterium sp. YY-03]|uniref:arginase family protein n=1 Tax=Microbacterium sp. YY-03 TaxID=3421636 RepID=UPI003D174F74
MTRFVIVPQWQGSPSPRAMALADGADAISGDLPRSAVVRVEVPVEAGESLQSGVLRASSLQKVRRGIADVLVSETDRCVLIGGDCSIAVAGIDHVYHPDLAVIWFDAHADLNSTSSSPSGAFAGMAARALLGDVPSELALSGENLAAHRLFVAGSRALDDDEAAFVEESEVSLFPVDALRDPVALVNAVRASGASRIYIHVDLDVLDPAHVTGVQNPMPFGLDPAELTATIVALRDAFELSGASLAGFAPSTPAAAVEDLGTILRIIGALAAA